MNEIINKIKEFVPKSKDLEIVLNNGQSDPEFGRVLFTTDRLNGKQFSVGFVIYSREPFLYSLTDNKDGIRNNLINFK